MALVAQARHQGGCPDGHGKRLKRLHGNTPHKFICQQWHLNPAIFSRAPTQLTLGLYSYFLGPPMLPGVISFSTYKGDLAGFPLGSHALLQEYEGWQGMREFYASRYETTATAQSRLPDFRNLLYWNPNMLITPGASATAIFCTADQVGKYCIVVQGLTATGLAGSASRLVEVKAPL